MKGPRECIAENNEANVAPVATAVVHDSANGNYVIRLPGSHSIHSNQREVDFSEYEWMGEEMEEFDKQCMEELYEEAFIEAVFEDMHEQEEEVSWLLGSLTAAERRELVQQLEGLSLTEGDNLDIPEICLLHDDEDDGAEEEGDYDLSQSPMSSSSSISWDQFITSSSSSSSDELDDDDDNDPEDR